MVREGEDEQLDKRTGECLERFQVRQHKSPKSENKSYFYNSFLAVGFFMLYCGTHDLLFPKPPTKNPVVAFPLISIICGIANVLHACGTFFYHSCRCTEGHILDISGMFTVTAFPFFYSFFRLLTVPSWDSTRNTTPISKLSHPSLRHLQLKVVLLCIVIAAFFGVGVWWSGSHHYTDERRDAVMTVIIVSDIVTSLLHFSLKLHSTQRGRVFKGMARAVVMLLVGLTVHSIDRFHKTMFPMLCFPSSPLQGHAIWHVATASSLFILYYLDRTENFVDLSATLKTFY